MHQVIGGANEEFIFSPRLDNLESSYCALQALIESVSDKDSLAADSIGRVIALFDHEEVRYISKYLILASAMNSAAVCLYNP